MRRTIFLVDGFNLYHSLVEASRALNGAGTKWLDLRSMCTSFLSEVGGGAQLERVHYFSALARHREAHDPLVTTRHLMYVECLRETGVEVELGQFKEKRISCPHCQRSIIRHEEKETDVAIGVRLLEAALHDQCDAIVLVSGDSDLSPAVRAAHRHRPAVTIDVAFPFNRLSFELKGLARRSFRIGARRYTQHQFADPFILRNGGEIHKPGDW